MARLNTNKTTKPKTAATSVIKTKSDRPTITTALGAPGYERKPKSELFLLGSSLFAGEITFHEMVDNRDARFDNLVRRNAEKDPQWMVDFVTWLRGKANIRTASVKAAGLASDVFLTNSAPQFVAPVVNGGLQRADEPGELMSFWETLPGRVTANGIVDLPRPLKRAFSQSAARLYNQYTALKYDGKRHAYRFGDVIRLSRANPEDALLWKPSRNGVVPSLAEQEALYKYLIAQTLKHEDREPPAILRMIHAARTINRLSDVEKHALLRGTIGQAQLAAAGMTWENVSGFGVMDRAAWEASIPLMGYEALLKNLRNLDEAGISSEAAEKVAGIIADPNRVAKSRQLPIRFYAAYQALKSLHYATSLDKALNLSVGNIPAMAGRTLILIDQSPSMFPGYGMSMVRSDMHNADLAKLFGSAAALRAEDATLVQFGTTSQVVPFEKGEAVLRLMDRFECISGTDILAAVARHYRQHDRVLIITDEQTQSSGYRTIDDIVPLNVPVHMWNVGGYKSSIMASGPNRYHLGGMSDECFTLMDMVERGESGRWPWEQ